MERITVWATAGAVALSFAGCARIQTHVVEKPRVDQQMHGNRGYLKGTPPPASQRPTRQMMETNVELPTMQELNPWRKPKQEAEPAGTPAPVASMPAEESYREPYQEPAIAPLMEPEQPVSVPAGGTSYTVQKGDTLQKIAKKFYGSSSKWYRIYKANKDVIKNADRIRPGLQLTIPDLAERGGDEYK